MGETAIEDLERIVLVDPVARRREVLRDLLESSDYSVIDHKRGTQTRAKGKPDYSVEPSSITVMSLSNQERVCVVVKADPEPAWQFQTARKLIPQVKPVDGLILVLHQAPSLLIIKRAAYAGSYTNHVTA